jgi:hypothetical protein
MVNDPNRVLRARAQAAAAPTVNVVPDPAVYNDPNRAAHVRELPPDPPTVSGPPPAASEPLPAAADTSSHNPAEGSAKDSADFGAPTVNVAPDPSRQTDREGSPAAKQVSLDAEQPAPTDATMRMELLPAPSGLPPPRPSSRSARTNVPLGGPLPPPVASAPRAAPQPVASAPRAPRLSAPKVSAPRPDPKLARMLDGVAPLPQPPVAAPRSPESTLVSDAPPERAPVVPLSILAQVPQGHERTNVAAPAISDGWQETDQTRVLNAVKTAGDPPKPRGRDLVFVGLGLVAVCVVLGVVARSGPKEREGPLPPEKIVPPAGYEAPKPLAEETLAPAPQPHREVKESPPPQVSTSSASVSGSSASGSSASGSYGRESAPLRESGGGAAPTRMPIPRCAVNVPAALEAKAAWVVDGKRKLLRLRVTPKRLAIMRVNLFVAEASRAEKAELVRTENSAVYFDAFLDPEPSAAPVKVLLDCECGIGNAEVQANIDKKSLAVDLKYSKGVPVEVIASKGHRR